MADLRIDAVGARPVGPDGAPPWDALRRGLDALPRGATLVIGTHGLRHSPFGRALDPHDGVLGFAWRAEGTRRTRSWMRRLHLGHGQICEGNGLAFGWAAHGDVWRAMARARAAGAALARVCMVVRRTRPDLTLALVTHSLGARVGLEAMLRAPRRAFDRLLLLAPADTHAHALAALEAPGGHGARALAVQTRENRAFDAALALACGRPSLLRAPDHPAWRVLVPADAPRGGRTPLVCHWSCYLRPGVWPAYRRWLLQGEAPGLAVRPAGPAPWRADGLVAHG